MHSKVLRGSPSTKATGRHKQERGHRPFRPLKEPYICNPLRVPQPILGRPHPHIPFSLLLLHGVKRRVEEDACVWPFETHQPLLIPPASQDSLGASPPSYSGSCQPVSPGPLPMSSPSLYFRGQSWIWQSRVPTWPSRTPAAPPWVRPPPTAPPSPAGSFRALGTRHLSRCWCPTPRALVCTCGQRPRGKAQAGLALCVLLGVSLSLPPHQDTAHPGFHGTLL